MERYKIVFIILLLLIASCKKETIVTSQDNIVPVDVDLQTGFQNHNIKVYLNQQISFQADLTSSVPLAGPIASFSTYLERNSNSIKVRWQSQTSGLTYKQDSSTVNLGSSKKYFIGLQITNDSLKVKVQDVPFAYL